MFAGCSPNCGAHQNGITHQDLWRRNSLKHFLPVAAGFEDVFIDLISNDICFGTGRVGGIWR